MILKYSENVNYDIIIPLEGISAMNECRDSVEGVHCQMEDCKKCKVYNVVNFGINKVHDQLKSLSLYDHYSTNINSIIES